MATKAPARKISFNDIFTFDFWRYLVKAVWLFFPGIFFLILGTLAFWGLSQGKDLMFITLEDGKRRVFLYCILAVLFWTYVTWYTTRLVGKAKTFQQPDDHHIWIRLMIQLPRLMGFTCLTVVILAFLQLKGVTVAGKTFVSSPWNIRLLLISIPYYFLIYVLWEKFIARDIDENAEKGIIDKYIHFLRRIRNIDILILLAGAVIVTFLHSFWALIILFLGMQIGLVLLLVIRRKITEIQGRSMYQQKEEVITLRDKSIFRRFWGLLRDDEDRAFSRAFLWISIIPVACYIATIVSVKVSVIIGSFPFVIIAFSALLILGNLAAMFSALARFNIHILIWAWAFLMGQEYHKVVLVEKKDMARQFENRQNLREYFTNWVTHRIPHPELMDSGQKLPVYFVLSDGGASRSGYWVASVLSRFEDSTHGNFSRNLFCLSGASGGSVGNATFFNVLRNKKNLDTFSCLQASKQYLASDFLTYTVARMLGPDVFKYIFVNLSPLHDRAYALSTAMEEAPDARGGSTRIINSKITEMKVGLSEIMTEHGQLSDSLPILCINTTRMQDGRPGVISTIKLNEEYFNKRVDVLSLLDKKQDLKLSSAVVLGASFPYLSPAGRIDKKDTTKKDKITSEYFVDGGYFDNSGAGVVNEMIIGMKQLMKDDPFLKQFKDKLDFYVLHITNDPNPDGEPILEKVKSLTNDLAAPLKTLVGSYGSQTSVNDLRLKSYMYFENNRDPGHYISINLYNLDDTMNFSMNWVISKRLLKGMDDRLEEKRVKAVLDGIKARAKPVTAIALGLAQNE